MDANNPAVAAQTAISPADLELVAKDPALLTATARKMLAIQMMYMHRRMADPNMPVGQRQAWMEFLAKQGDTVPKQNVNAAFGVNGPGFSVQIVMNAPTQAAPAAIPAQPADVIEMEPAQAEAHTTPTTEGSDDGNETQELD